MTFYPNLLTPNQSSVEADLTGLSSYGTCTAARTTSIAESGAACVQITTIGGGNPQAGVATNALIAITAGTQYTGAVSGRTASVVRSAYARIAWYQSNGSSLSAVKSTSDGTSADLSASAWTHYTVTDTAPSDAAFARVNIFITSSAVGDVHYADCFGLWLGTETTWHMSVGQAYEPTWLPAEALYGNATHYGYEMKKLDAPEPAPKTTYPSATGGTTYPTQR